jgi:hypothetical protein
MTRISRELAPEIVAFRDVFSARFPVDSHDHKDWLRCSYAFRLIAGRSLLDIGPGIGMMLAAAETRGGFDRLSALDIHRHSRCIAPERVDFRIGSIADASLDLDEHDTVVCMEVIEHLPESANPQVLANLRRLASRRLLVTVPFDEPEPLWRHDKPGGHRQRFTLDKAAAVFPTGTATILPRYKVDWLFIIEDRENPRSEFSMLKREELYEEYGVLSDPAQPGSAARL